MDIANITQTTKTKSFWDYQGDSHYVDDLFLMESPYPLLCITAAYLVFVLKVGPKFMSNKAPMNFNNLLIFYNAVQVLFSAYLFNMGLQMLTSNGAFNSACNSARTSPIMRIGFYYYFIAKITELLDTIFFVLRKKQNQVTFLHVYHHSAMLWNTWVLIKYDPTYTLVFLGTLNSLIHTFMYAYYGLSAFPLLAKFLWWKKYLTALQLVQFVLGLVYAIVNHFYVCPMAKVTFLIILSNGTFFLILFSNFYLRSYSKRVATPKRKHF
ncbi:hypothetical protein ACJJTC_015287 [Scirpophaga incertulas]